MYGAIQPLLDDVEVEEIWLNSPTEIFCSRNGKAELTNLLLSEKEVESLVERMLRSSGRHLDYANPCVDATLATGERLHVVIPPVTANWSINIRKHHAKARRITDLVKLGLIPTPVAVFLKEAVKIGLNILVSGPTQAGKTTTVRALCGEIPSNQRVVTCEEVLELNLKSADCVSMQTRNASLEGHGEITLRDLVKESLRMRPDRLIIGEVRGAESLDMLIALNCGIPGMSTIHANTAHAALMKLTTLPLLAGENVTAAFVVPTVANAIDLVVQLRGTWQGSRAVSEIVALDRSIENGRIGGVSLYRPGADSTDLAKLVDTPDSTADGTSSPTSRNSVWTAQSATFDFEAAFGSRARHLSTLVESQNA